MTGREFGEKLRRGERVYGTAIVSPSPHWPSVVQQAGLDFVFLDTEHITQDRVALSWMCRTYRALGIVPVVRIPRADPFLACQMYDGGACGLVAAYIETPEEVRALVGATKYRPLKGKRLERVLQDPASLEPEMEAYVRERCADNILIVNIESRPAMDNLDAILAVPGLDGVLVGPHDMTCNFGVPEQYHHPAFEEAMSELIAKARAANVGVGAHFFWDTIEQEVAWAKAGANLLLHSGDISLFSAALNKDIGHLKKAMGDSVVKAGGEEVII
ncbi:MAG TPA: aldolase/citrate lyase family protein [Candidatus Hydrogenedentes bacterium]|jgi:4-hydroxy-2-oxoheptanedioate aldolase|nr:aldolase/citrate lyase family protein [Candidatus Hydrogenedentota bacterium]HPJ98715.1 aldolase/citrate lyase family protein [Candidatus Hydrogenedentota bacterium]